MGMGVSENRSRERKKRKRKKKIEPSETHRYGYIRQHLQESGIKKNYASLYVLYDREMPLFSRFLPYSDVSSAV